MNILVRQIIIFIVISFILALSSFSLLALAQEPTPFEISIIPQADYAILGQPFTYTVVVTNVSQTPTANIFVKIKIPEGTTHNDARATDLKWFGGNPYPGTSVEEIIWFTPEAIAPGEMANFELIVNVLPENSAQQLVNKDYIVTQGEGVEDVLASGPPVITQLLAAEPTPTPRPTPFATASPLPTSMAPSPTSVAKLNVTATRTISNPIATPIIPRSTDVASTAVPIPEVTAQATTSQLPSFIITLVIIGLVVLVIIGLVWFFIRK